MLTSAHSPDPCAVAVDLLGANRLVTVIERAQIGRYAS
jgi:hypothetical protein